MLVREWRKVPIKKINTITIVPYKTRDKSFIQLCQNQEEFKKTIGEFSINYNFCFIIRNRDSRIGCAMISPYNMFGICYATVSVFIIRQYRLLSAAAIRVVLNEAANVSPKPEKIMFLVYEDNLPCIALMDHFKIKCSAHIPRICYRDGHYVGLRYYFFPLNEEHFFFEISQHK